VPRVSTASSFRNPPPYRSEIQIVSLTECGNTMTSCTPILRIRAVGIAESLEILTLKLACVASSFDVTSDGCTVTAQKRPGALVSRVVHDLTIRRVPP